MVNPRKVHTLARKTLFELNDGREVLKIKEYAEDNTVWRSLARSALTGIVLYILIMLIAVLASPDWFLALFQQIGEAWSAIIIALSMAVCATVYSVLSDVVFRIRYRNLRSTLCGYRSDLALLERISRGQDGTFPVKEQD